MNTCTNARGHCIHPTTPNSTIQSAQVICCHCGTTNPYGHGPYAPYTTGYPNVTTTNAPVLNSSPPNEGYVSPRRPGLLFDATQGLEQTLNVEHGKFFPKSPGQLNG